MDENTYTLGQQKFVAVPETEPLSCDECAFKMADKRCPQQRDNPGPGCMGYNRKDGQDIIWKEVVDG